MAKKKIFFYFNFLVFLFLASLFVIMKTYFSSMQILKIYVLNLLTLLPVLFYVYNILQKKNFLVIPYLAAFCSFFFLTYTSFFFFETNFISINNVDKILNYLILSIVFLYSGYFILHFNIKKKKIQINYFILNSKNIILLFVILYLFVFYFFLTDIYYLDLIKNFVFFLFSVLLAETFSKKILLTNCLLFTLYIILLLFDASSSSIMPSLIYFSCFIFTLMFLKKKIPIFFSLFFILFFYSVTTTKSYHREMILKNTNLKKYQIFQLYIENFTLTHKSIENLTLTHNSHVITRSRIHHSAEVFSIVVNLTPSEVPYFKGESLKKIYSKFIPRFIWKNKPLELDGNMWGKRYKILNKSDNITSWNFPVLSEFYANYGLIGCLFGMLLFGFFLRAISVPIRNLGNNNDINILSIAIFYQFIFQETNLSQVMGGLLYSFFFTFILITLNQLFKIKISK